MKYLSKFIKFIFSRLVIICVLILIQIIVILLIVWQLSTYFIYIYVAFSALSLFIVFLILGKDDNPSIKIPWIIAIVVLPIFGGLFYLIFGNSRLPKIYKQNMIDLKHSVSEYYPDNKEVYENLEADCKIAAGQAKYLKNVIGMPVYQNTQCEYLELGEVKFERLKKELLLAKHYIFMEYFIIQEGKMWDPILEILSQKVKEGIEVRLLYDDFGCMQTLPDHYYKKIESLGIRCLIFNQFKPSLSSSVQNRDHRKIAIIDGHTGFTGGINLSDEYINAFPKHGHWKDCAVVLKGDAVYSLTLMFLESWNFTLNNTAADFDDCTPTRFHKEPFISDGYVMPYGDTPLDDEYVSESIYLNIINTAKDYLYIASPYFIVDNELITALKLAAKRGVDLRILLPHVADKWYVHVLTRSYYPHLIKAGVKIYEYTPGFVHSKLFVCDDSIATVGTVNLDYRSLYHHFECGLWLYKNSAIMEIKKDYLTTLEKSDEVTYAESLKVSLFHRLVRSILRLIAPLM